MRLLLDEMISPAIARELRGRGCDVQAIKRDRPELQSLADAEIVRRMVSERRAIVTNDVADFAPIHARIVAEGDEHYGMVFTDDSTLPRNRANVTVWVEALAELLSTCVSEDYLRNGTHYLR